MKEAPAQGLMTQASVQPTQLQEMRAQPIVMVTQACGMDDKAIVRNEHAIVRNEHAIVRDEHAIVQAAHAKVRRFDTIVTDGQPNVIRT